MVIVHAAKPLYGWVCLEVSSSLQTNKNPLATLPTTQ
jgi:hypothetical protein